MKSLIARMLCFCRPSPPSQPTQQYKNSSSEIPPEVHLYRTLTENILASVIIRNNTRTITYCSPYTEVLTGYPRSHFTESQGDGFISIVHSDDKDNYIRGMTISEQGDPYQFRFRINHATGIEVWAETRIMPLFAPSGELLSTLAITFDVTGTVRYQRQIEERNKDIQDFTYMLSHDLKSPLVTIKGMLGIIKSEYGETLSTDLQELHEHISRACDRLELLVAGVLEYSKVTLQSFELGSIDLGALLDRINVELAPELTRTQSKLTLLSDFPPIQGDELRVYQIFQNILGNAIKYRDPNRLLTITVESFKSKNPREIGILIKDNGSGIPAERLTDIFRPFHRACSGDIPGAGIGLATVKKLIEKLGGKVSVESTVGVGTEFRLILRLA